MTPTPPDLNEQAALDAICLQFEQEWRQGNGPKIESFLDGHPASGHRQILAQLLLLELEYLELEPIGFMFVIFFVVVMIIQLIGMFLHRWGTASQIISTTKLGLGPRAPFSATTPPST